MTSRREFLGTALAGAALGAVPAAALAAAAPSAPVADDESLCGTWAFRVDAEDVGLARRWHAEPAAGAEWQSVQVPHTWQVDARHAEHYGPAWYRRAFDVPADWRDRMVRLEFDAVFHSATVWVNGVPVGEHLRKGYTRFALDVTHALRWGARNEVVVRVTNAFDDRMLPRGRSSDWAHDGGIYRPVRLLVTPRAHVERLAIAAEPDLATGHAALTVAVHCRNAGTRRWRGTLSARVVDDATGLAVPVDLGRPAVQLDAGARRVVTVRGRLPEAKRWHFDAPNLYRLEVVLGQADDRGAHRFADTFGVRKLELRGTDLLLNGERVRLMGVERMAGSHPDFGMAEPAEWIEHDHRDLKALNCVFTRVHWPQDRRVLDYCDRHGILMQAEVPTWGSATFARMGAEPDAELMENGLEQLRELVASDGNHPSVVLWGLCNEIGGQNPAAYRFAERMAEEARRLDPGRPYTYASHSLRSTPGRDVARLMDVVETNEYFGSWYPGTAATVGAHLDELHATFPGKPIVVGEYGYCACAADRPEGDDQRRDVLATHTAAIRARDFVAGAIFFCYNDYRTHQGDRGTGALRQRVHGVVDVYGARKPSFDALRAESSPIASLTVARQGSAFELTLVNRRDLPSYTLRGYELVAVLHGQGDIPVEKRSVAVPVLAPGESAVLRLAFGTTEPPRRVRVDVMRPTGFSAFTAEWTG